MKKKIMKLAYKHNFLNSEVIKFDFNIDMYRLNLCVENLNIDMFKLFSKLEKSGFKITEVARFHSEKKPIIGIGFCMITKKDYKKLKHGKLKIQLKKRRKN